MSDTDSNISATALKAFTVLDIVGARAKPVSVQDVADEMGADRATAYRMLMTLVHAGYVTRDETTKSYFLSYKILSLARNFLSDDERSTQILHCLRVISDATGETVHYSALEKDCAVLVYRAKGMQRVSVDFQIGDRSPLHCTSIGKVLLAYADIRFTDQILAGAMPKVASRTIIDPQTMRKELALVRAQGYAFDDMEFADDMRCLAIPVFEKGAHVPGGIAISGPSSRFDKSHLERLCDIALPHAQELSHKLGGI